MPPVVWGDDPGCAHDWGDELIVSQPSNHNEGFNERWGQGAGARKQEEARPQEFSQGRFCRRCSAWLGHYGLEPTPDLYVEHTVEIFREVRRVLRPDGTLFLNLGDCYGSGEIGRNDDDPENLARRAALFGTGRRKDSRPHEREQSRVRTGLKPKDLVGIPWRIAFALQGDGWWLRSDIIWSKPNSMPSSVEDRPGTAHEYVFLLTKSATYFYDVEGFKVPATPPTGGRQRAALRGDDRYVGTDFKDGSAELGEGRSSRHQGYQPFDRRLRSVWEIPTAQYPFAHFATFPPELPERCVRLGTSEHGVCPDCGAPWRRLVEKGDPELAANTWSPNGAASYELDEAGMAGRSLADGSTLKHVRRVETVGWEPTCGCVEDVGDQVGEEYARPAPIPATVLDPFSGSGTTLAVARRLGRRGLGVELGERYAAQAVEHRLTRWWRDPPRPAQTDDDQLSLKIAAP